MLIIVTVYANPIEECFHFSFCFTSLSLSRSFSCFVHSKFNWIHTVKPMRAMCKVQYMSWSTILYFTIFSLHYHNLQLSIALFTNCVCFNWIKWIELNVCSNFSSLITEMQLTTANNMNSLTDFCSHMMFDVHITTHQIMWNKRSEYFKTCCSYGRFDPNCFLFVNQNRFKCK